MAIVSIEEVKNYLRLQSEDTDEDDFLRIIMQAAEDSINQITGRTLTSDDARAKLVCFMMISDLYENRTLTVSDNEQIRKAMNYLLIQLQYKDEEVILP